MACYIKIHKDGEKKINDLHISNDQVFKDSEIHLKSRKNTTIVKIDNPNFWLQLKINGYLENHYQAKFILNKEIPKAIIQTIHNSIIIEHLS